MSCDVNALLRDAAGFQGLSQREQWAAIAQLLCDISQNGPAWAIVFPNGSAVGPNGVIDTTGTTTSGIQEAINSLPVQTNYAGPLSGGGTIVLAPGRFDCTSQIIIPNNFPYDLSLKGSGKMLTLVNYNSTTVQDFIVTQRTASNPGDSIGYPSLNLSVRDCAFSYATTANKAAIFKLTYVNEGLIVNCAFATLESFEFPGIGASLVYLNGTPRIKPGVLGFVLDSVSNGNILDFRNCSFYGLACGADIRSDHIRFEHCIFANIGMYWPTGVGAPTVGTQWTTTVAIPNDLTGRRQNCYANGMGLVRNGGVWEMNVHYCQWFYCNVCLAAYQDGFANCFALNPMFESSNRGLVSIGDNASQVLGDTNGPGFVAITQETGIGSGGYMNALSGVLSGTNPRIFSELALNATLPDADGLAPAFSYNAAVGSIFTANNNGFHLRTMTKAARNAMVSIDPGQMIFQTDNTPGLRVWNGTNWVRYTETVD